MASLKWLSVLCVFCFILPLGAQTNDWNSVEKLAPGTPISVIAMRIRQNCEVVRVTDSELVCDRHIGEIDRRLVFRSQQVREVRLEEPENNQRRTGTMVGTVLGGLAGGLIGKPGSGIRVYALVYGTPLAASLGGAIGQSIHRHGIVVYRR